MLQNSYACITAAYAVVDRVGVRGFIRIIMKHELSMENPDILQDDSDQAKARLLVPVLVGWLPDLIESLLQVPFWLLVPLLCSNCRYYIVAKIGRTAHVRMM